MGIEPHLSKYVNERDPTIIYYVIYDFGNIAQPLLMLARHQMKHLLKEIPFDDLRKMLAELNIKVSKVRE